MKIHLENKYNPLVINGCFHSPICNGEKTESIDASGTTPSVTAIIGERIVRLLGHYFDIPPMSRTVDIGAGLGHMQNSFAKAGISSYSIEGAASIRDSIISPSDRVITCDITRDLNGLTERPFSLATCIEVMEHVPTPLVSNALRYISSLADYSFFSIHQVGPVNECHVTIEDTSWWLRQFEIANMQPTLIADCPYETSSSKSPVMTSFIDFTGWRCSAFYIVKSL